MYETWYKMTTMIQSGLDISPVITHRFPYLEFEQAFQLMRSGESGKIILQWADLRVASGWWLVASITLLSNYLLC
jgi:threonine 3-dehydrogenase